MNLIRSCYTMMIGVFCITTENKFYCKMTENFLSVYLTDWDQRYSDLQRSEVQLSERLNLSTSLGPIKANLKPLKHNNTMISYEARQLGRHYFKGCQPL